MLPPKATANEKNKGIDGGFFEEDDIGAEDGVEKDSEEEDEINIKNDKSENDDSIDLASLDFADRI